MLIAIWLLVAVAAVLVAARFDVFSGRQIGRAHV